MNGVGRSQTCPNCGRLLSGAARCPNCGVHAARHEQFTTGGYSSAPSNPATPRWLLLAGTLVLLSALVYVVAPRSGGSGVPAPDAGATGVLTARPGDLPAPPPSVAARAPSPAFPAAAASPRGSRPPAPTPEPFSEQDREFWRRKAARDLKEAGEYIPTEQEKAAWEHYRWQDHINATDAARSTDYVLRRPELTGGGGRR